MVVDQKKDIYKQDEHMVVDQTKDIYEQIVSAIEDKKGPRIIEKWKEKNKENFAKWGMTDEEVDRQILLVKKQAVNYYLVEWIKLKSEYLSYSDYAGNNSSNFKRKHEYLKENLMKHSPFSFTKQAADIDQEGNVSLLMLRFISYCCSPNEKSSINHKYENKELYYLVEELKRLEKNSDSDFNYSKWRKIIDGYHAIYRKLEERKKTVKTEEKKIYVTDLIMLQSLESCFRFNLLISIGATLNKIYGDKTSDSSDVLGQLVIGWLITCVYTDDSIFYEDLDAHMQIVFANFGLCAKMAFGLHTIAQISNGDFKRAELEEIVNTREEIQCYFSLCEETVLGKYHELLMLKGDFLQRIKNKYPLEKQETVEKGYSSIYRFYTEEYDFLGVNLSLINKYYYETGEDAKCKTAKEVVKEKNEMTRTVLRYMINSSFYLNSPSFLAKKYGVEY